MRLLLKLFLGISITGLTVWTVAAGAPGSKNSDGAALFKQNCTMCHGADGKGFKALKTPDFTDPKWQAREDNAELEDRIKNGKKGTAMQAFGDRLKADEIKALIAHIRSLNSQKKN